MSCRSVKVRKCFQEEGREHEYSSRKWAEGRGSGDVKNWLHFLCDIPIHLSSDKQEKPWWGRFLWQKDRKKHTKYQISAGFPFPPGSSHSRWRRRPPPCSSMMSFTSLQDKKKGPHPRPQPPLVRQASEDPTSNIPPHFFWFNPWYVGLHPRRLAPFCGLDTKQT